jgi:NAD(P)H dehydrogenase (quinone)
VSWTVRADLAEAAVAALITPSLFDGISPPLTSKETLVFADIAKLASDLLGRDIEHVFASEEKCRQAKLAMRYPDGMIDMFKRITAFLGWNF